MFIVSQLNTKFDFVRRGGVKREKDLSTGVSAPPNEDGLGWHHSFAINISPLRGGERKATHRVRIVSQKSSKS
jgi:hypothetical protein